MSDKDQFPVLKSTACCTVSGIDHIDDEHPHTAHGVLLEPLYFDSLIFLRFIAFTAWMLVL